jgi:hypothetical protein
MQFLGIYFWGNKKRSGWFALLGNAGVLPSSAALRVRMAGNGNGNCKGRSRSLRDDNQKATATAKTLFWLQGALVEKRSVAGCSR